MLESNPQNAIATEVLDRPEVQDYTTLLAFSRKRTYFKKEQKLAEHANK